MGVIDSYKVEENIKRETLGQTTTSNKQDKDKEIKETYKVKSIDKSQDIVYTLPNKTYPIINLSGSLEVEDINTQIQQKYEGDEYFQRTFEYNYYVNDEILSLVIGDYSYGSSVTKEGYYDVFNINVKTGKIISNSDLLKSKNIDEQTFLRKLPQCYKNKFLELRRSI